MNAATRRRLDCMRALLDRYDESTVDSRSREDDKTLYDAYGALSGLEADASAPKNVIH